jgi:acetyl-CoA carboxylase biotin carboxylase subunit
MGDKAVARQTAAKAKVPTVPGSDGPVDNQREAIKEAQRIGFPVIIKAVAGGGGKGMRIVHNAAAFSKEFDSARSEAEKAFGNGAVYIEKYIEQPRHIEFQMLADESPSPFLTPKLREEMGKVAVRLTESIGYHNAGTIEFLVDRHGKFYFMEMNTRIQVEHGVTEEVTDIDLVRRQILIACGEKLELNQKDIKITGHAIECRINAEDPARNFTPSPGTIGLYYTPGGHGVRVDSHCYSGYTIPPNYDSMVAKLISVGANRQKALDRMHRALSEYIIRGIHTTIPVCRAIMKDPVFRQGGATTKYLEDFFERTPKELWSAAPLT